MIPARRVVACALFAAAALSAACGRPETDIVATSTEDVGDYNVVGAARERDGLRATVCVANPAHADAVADRVLRQLYSHGLPAVTLDVYGGQRAIARVVLTQGVRRSEPLAGAPPAGACADHSPKEHS